MLKRKIQAQLSDWKARTGHKSLLLLGARQVGKTYACRQLAEEEYENVVELNFIENPELSAIFSGSLRVDDLLTNFSLYFPSGHILPGKTLIFLDEVQECPQALTSLKFWTQDQRFDVIATGSSLGLKYRKDGYSFPVGSIETIQMHALDFEEFLWAEGIADDVIKVLENCFRKKTAVPEAIHQKMQDYLKRYMVVGGMPEVLQTYVDTRNLMDVHQVQKRIYSDYLFDIAHYAEGSDKIRAEKCYRSIPVQLSKENHKFQYSVVEHKGTSSRFESSIDWLKGSFLVEQVFSLKRLEFPPELYMDDTNFRLYMTDIGMMTGTYQFEVKKSLLEDETMENVSRNLILGTVKGGIYEALAADFLIKQGIETLYFYKDEKSTSELEFVISGADGLVPIEIKAGRKRANSLERILKMDQIPYGYKFSSQNVGCDGKRITLPLYMLMFVGMKSGEERGNGV